MADIYSNYHRRKGKHLTVAERLTIERLLLAGFPIKEIQRIVGCCLATIYNEVKRATYIHTNSDLTEEERYSPDLAEARYRRNLKEKGSMPKIKKDKKLCEYIRFLIAEQKYSAEAVLLTIQQQKIKFDVEIKSVNTIYTAIEKGYIDGLDRTFLPVQKKRKQKKVTKKEQKRATRGISIEKRPDEINKRETFGHWEMDCVESSRESEKALLVLTERLTRKELIFILKKHTAKEVVRILNHINRAIGSHFYNIFKSITTDNGHEFMDIEGMEKGYRAKKKRTTIYQCHPYCSYERGSNENQNRLIRRFLPKGTDFTDLTISFVKEIEYWINTYPRKIFGGADSNDIFIQELKKINIPERVIDILV